MEICATASRMFDHVVVAAMKSAKASPLFSDEERIEMPRSAHLANVEVVQSELVVDLAQRLEVDFRPGLESGRFESELLMAQTNNSVVVLKRCFAQQRKLTYRIRCICDITQFGTDCSHLYPSQSLSASERRCP